MVDFQRKKNIRKVIYSRITIFVLFVVVIFLLRAVYDIYKKERVSFKSVASVEENYNDLKNRQSMLKSEIERLNTDKGVEEEIRSKFSVSKPGETVVVIVDNSSNTSTDSENTGQSFWQKIFGWMW
ncbi:MAG: septum formation initiator family protein [Candidatus Taylorbacteria bacterium]|nr:septum formation initiator family protein [Candidatus Taylorbacteria bacterium]